jgi:allantoin racemase
MKLLVLNPNANAAMTAGVVEQVRGIAEPGVMVRGVTALDGPPVIASRESFALGAEAAVRALRAEPEPFDAVLLACFGDPGLAALRATCQVPVAGMAESAFDEAAALARPFHVLTAGAAWDSMLREAIDVQGHGRLLHGITVLEGTGADMAARPEAFAARVQQVLDGLAADGAPTCILAGAGFVPLLPRLRYGGMLLDGVGTAVRWLARHWAGPLRCRLHRPPAPPGT